MKKNPDCRTLDIKPSESSGNPNVRAWRLDKLPPSDDYKPGNPNTVRILCVSDTHGLHKQLTSLPPADILVHTGDFSMRGRENEVIAFNKWIKNQNYKHKIVISGNHEISFDLEREAELRQLFALE